MQTALDIGTFIVTNYQAILAALVAICSGVIAIALLVPGDQPEKFLQGVVDFLAKFSKKPKDSE